MPRTGIANLPLHGGRAPRWLFERMTLLAREVTLAIVEEYGPQEMLVRLSDPAWFQAFGCVLGFDWHSSGVTTTVCGALKEGLRGVGADAGLLVCGGKGRTSRRTPAELEEWGQRLGIDAGPLVYASRMSAKVDSAALQDGYQLYHHTFFFVPGGGWCVVQQGMHESNGYARRYHWLSSDVADFVCEPHHAICSEGTGVALNMVAAEASEARRASALVAGEPPAKTAAELERLKTLELPSHHHIDAADLHPKSLERILLRTYEDPPADFESLLAREGVGAKTIRALALVSEVVYGAPASYRDPARYSFAHGGKDGHPYPVDRDVYDRTIATLRRAVERANVGERERLHALRRLAASGGG